MTPVVRTSIVYVDLGRSNDSIIVACKYRKSIIQRFSALIRCIAIDCIHEHQITEDSRDPPKSTNVCRNSDDTIVRQLAVFSNCDYRLRVLGIALVAHP